MLLNERRNEGAVSNIPQDLRGQFTIAANGKAFEILSSTLYQDKIGSIVREISCNAYDAHRENGTPDLPFEIHLPSIMEPFFSVKDYGIGMNTHTVENVFTSLFVSTKENSNDSVGAFGLGSKTPFAYTDTFNVVAIKDGVSRTFTMYKREDGTPIHSLLLEKDTSEPNGVEIIMPVNNLNDRSAFARAIARQLHFFKVRPIIKGGDHSVEWQDEPTDTDILVKYNNITMFKKGDYRNGVVAIMGPVGYELNFQILKEKLPKYDKVITWLSNRTIRVNFNIGDVSVTPSRENLSYDNRTIKAFDRVFDGFLEEITTAFEQKFTGFKSPWERAQFIAESNDDVGDIIKIKSDKDNDGVVRFSGRYAYFDVQSIKEAMGANACNIEIKSVQNLVNTKNSYAQNRVAINEFNNSRKFILIADDCKYMKRRYMTVHNQNQYSTCWVVVPSDLEKSLDVQKVFEDSGIATKLLSEFDPVDLSNSYSFVKAHGYMIPFEEFKTSNEDLYKTRYHWTKIVDKTVIEPAFYVVSDNGNISDYKALTKFKEMVSLGLVPNEYQIPIYAFPVKTSEKIAKDENWILLSDYINEHFNADVIAKLYADVWESAAYLNAFNYLRENTDARYQLVLNSKQVKQWLIDVELTLFSKTELASQYEPKVLRQILCQRPNSKYHHIEETIKDYINKDFRKVIDHYPLLKYMRQSYYFTVDEKAKEEFGEYINMYNEKHGEPALPVVDLEELEKLLTPSAT